MGVPLSPSLRVTEEQGDVIKGSANVSPRVIPELPSIQGSKPEVE